MAGKKGMRHYSESFKDLVRKEHDRGMGIRALSRKYNISICSASRWCSEAFELPKSKGRPRKTPLPLEDRIKDLERENALLRSFLAAVGRK